MRPLGDQASTSYSTSDPRYKAMMTSILVLHTRLEEGGKGAEKKLWDKDRTAHAWSIDEQG